MKDCYMEDMGFRGQRFTWQRGLLHERLDRYVCNTELKNMPCQLEVVNLARIQYDHSPILLSFKSRQSQEDVGRTFRYLAA